MGQTLAIWRWRPGWPFRSESGVMAGFGKDQASFAIVRFDAHAFADAIRKRFGDGDDAPFSIDVCDFTGHRANWIILSSGWTARQETLIELVQMCEDRGLHIFAS